MSGTSAGLGFVGGVVFSIKNAAFAPFVWMLNGVARVIGFESYDELLDHRESLLQQLAQSSLAKGDGRSDDESS